MNSLKPCWFLLRFPSFGGICPENDQEGTQYPHVWKVQKQKKQERKKEAQGERAREEREGGEEPVELSYNTKSTTFENRAGAVGISWYEYLWTINTESDRGNELQPKRPANVLLAKCSGRLHARNESPAGSNFHWTAGSSCQPWSQHGKLTKQTFRARISSSSQASQELNTVQFHYLFLMSE